MPSNLQNRSVPQAWLITILGAAASIPAGVIINQFPNSEATVGGAAMIIGATIAGSIAATRTVSPGGVGLRAGFLGGVIAVLVPIPSVATTTWPASRFIFFVFTGGAVLCIASAFGWVFGHIGGWIAGTITARRPISE
jgi:hypothetical protein